MTTTSDSALEGQPVRSVVRGRRDVDRNLPVTRDTIFRIASATKPSPPSPL